MQCSNYRLATRSQFAHGKQQDDIAVEAMTESMKLMTMRNKPCTLDDARIGVSSKGRDARRSATFLRHFEHNTRISNRSVLVTNNSSRAGDRAWIGQMFQPRRCKRTGAGCREMPTPRMQHLEIRGPRVRSSLTRKILTRTITPLYPGPHQLCVCQCDWYRTDCIVCTILVGGLAAVALECTY